MRLLVRINGDTIKFVEKKSKNKVEEKARLFF